MIKVGIIDYGGGNLRSLTRAVESLGHEVNLISSAEGFAEITHILFPGQGAYGDCLAKLKERELISPLINWIKADKPFFGICVGYQLLFEGSEEAEGEKGLNLFSGKVVKFKSATLKIPHMGWNSLMLNYTSHPIWSGLPEEPFFYFVHSYYPEGVKAEDSAAVCNYGRDFTACIIRGNIFATQFHPEKSQENGIQLIKNFLSF